MKRFCVLLVICSILFSVVLIEITNQKVEINNLKILQSQQVEINNKLVREIEETKEQNKRYLDSCLSLLSKWDCIDD